MKLILLFEIDEEKYDLDDLFLEYHIYDYRRDEEVRFEKCGIKPLPPKKDIYAVPPQNIFIKGKEVDAYSLGWNDFRDEIIGRRK